MKSAPTESQSSPAAVAQPKVHCLVVKSKLSDPRAATYLKTARSLIAGIAQIEISDLYFIEGDLSQDQLEILRTKILSDAIAQEAVWQTEEKRKNKNAVEVAYKPGVTDAVSQEIVRIAKVLALPVVNAATGTRFVLRENLSENQLKSLAKNVFANDVIQHFQLGTIRPSFTAITSTAAISTTAINTTGSNKIEIIPICKLDDAALLELSRERRAALDLAEMRALQAHYQSLTRDPSDIEFEMFAQTWSEHCVHKTFRAKILSNNNQKNDNQEINGLLKTYIRAATEKINKSWVRSAFVDNAGVIEFDEDVDLAFKVETHNHPSALEPFGGANTGVGGVIRDVLAMGAKPIAVTDVLCFGNTNQQNLPSGILHPQRIQDGVVAGIEDYGNKMGIPTVNGAVFYDNRYTSNPLVYCGCLGAMPQSPQNNKPLQSQANDLIVALGGRTGRDGLRGATFSSLDINTDTFEVAGSSVQIGNPIVEKQVQDVILKAKHLYRAMTDCGAGGFSSAVGEMAKGLGAKIHLENISLKYPGLRPWEMWLSEAQERMVLAVEKNNFNELQELCDVHGVEAIVLGEFTNTGKLQIFHFGQMVSELDLHFLHEGIPQKILEAQTQPSVQHKNEMPSINPQTALLRLLAHPNIKSREEIIRRYDTEVGGGTTIKPLVGVAQHGPSDAAVVLPRPGKSLRAVAIANGLCPQFSAHSYDMAWLAIDEAVRNAVCVGADPDRIAILDNFCWGNPTLPDRLGSLLAASQGCHDAALAYGTPFISGKDSLYNEYTDESGNRHAIPGTLLISAIGIVPDATKAISMDIKNNGNHLYLLGNLEGELGESHLAKEFNFVGGAFPATLKNPLPRYRALHAAINAGFVRAAHDCSEGGLAVALSEMCIAGRIGASIQIHCENETAIFFGEGAGKIVLEINPAHNDEFEKLFLNIPLLKIGTTGGNTLKINSYSWDIAELEMAWRGELATTSHSQIASSTISIEKNNIAIHASSKPKALILKAPGSNRDPDVALALEMAGANTQTMPLQQLRQQKINWQDFQMLVLPGGFSFGDNLGAGKVWALELGSFFKDQLDAFVATGKPVIGICNGFQVLVKTGLLPGNGIPATLTFNAGGHFECRWVTLETVSDNCIWTKGIKETFCPVAHGEGNFQISEADISKLKANKQIALRYSGSQYPHNPNGSVQNIAGVCNTTGNVLGLMPHPENHILAHQHPGFTRKENGGLGLQLFQRGVAHAQELGK